MRDRLVRARRRDVFALFELQDPDANLITKPGGSQPFTAESALDPILVADLSALLRDGDCFSWRDGRIQVLLSTRMGGDGIRRLRLIGRRLSTREVGSASEALHPTPAIGYVRLRAARTIEELFSKAEVALGCATSSLEIEPFRYDPKLSNHGKGPLAWLSLTWKNAPQSVVLSFQLVVTLMLGLGVPFLVYAAFDAFGMDITGPVYIGVVIVLVMTATSIWVEGLLALRATEPPTEPGAPYPVATVIIPAYLPNEQKTIVETVNAFLRLDYPNLVQVIVAYNSPDLRLLVEDELQQIAETHAGAGRFLIEPIRVANSTSKAQNVNAVIGRVRGAFVGIYDADHHPLPDSLLRAWRWLSNGWDIVQGRCSIRNGHESWIARMVAVEFEQIYAVSHPGRARLHGFGIFGGSNGFWRTAVLHQTRMRVSMLTEDIDSSIRALEGGFRITGDRDLISEELAPTSLRALLNQRLRWAQGWFQVSLQRILPALRSPKVSLRQKAGLLQLLVWRELFPWYSIQVIPILAYWIWVYGWSHIDWMVPIFLATTIYTFSVGPGQILFAYLLSRKVHIKKSWFFEYLFVSTLLYAPFKDTLSRISHLKEGMRERTWRVTPRLAASRLKTAPAYATAGAAVVLLLMLVGEAKAAPAQGLGFSPEHLRMLIGGEATTIRAARQAARGNRNSEAAALFDKAIRAVPRRRAELLPEYADALTYSGQSGAAVPLYREIVATSQKGVDTYVVRSHLALALGWSGQNQAALTAYNDLLSKRPGDGGLLLNRSRVLVALNRQGEPALLARTALVPCTNCGEPRLREPPKQALGGSPTLRQVATSASSPAAALSAWTAVLRTSPDDVDARLHRAQALSQLGRHEESLRGFLGALDLARKNEGARRGAFDETATLARVSAQEDRNADAAAGFASATALDPSRRRELLREHADQLTFSNRAAEAVPLYLEALEVGTATPLNRRRAIAGLSNAYTALESPDEALAGFASLRRAAPGDGDLAWAEEVFRARDAARTDQNAASARLFASAMMRDAGRAGELRREYADQLRFSGASDEAVPIYRAILADPAQLGAERNTVLLSLAEALNWSDQPAEALATYDVLLKANPDDVGVGWNRLVLMARQAAQIDKSKESANLFFEAIRLDPVRGDAILREYADQLSFVGRPGGAIPVYQKALATQLSVPDRLAAETGLAQAQEWAGHLPEAQNLYGALAAANPADRSLQWRFLVVSARAEGQKDRNKEAAVLFAQAIQLAPEQRIVILKEYADKLTFSDRSKAAVPLYRELVSLDGGASATNSRKLRLDLARALSWSGQYGPAIAEYRDLARTYPRDVEVRNSLARALQWSGRQGEAKATFQQVLQQDPANAEGQRGLAQLEDWQGHHRIAQGILEQRLRANPNDLEARRLLAQSEVWLGRPDKAIKLLQVGPEAPPVLRPVPELAGDR